MLRQTSKHLKLVLIFLLVSIFSCSPIEMGKRIAGTSIEALEKEKEGRFSRISPQNLPDSYAFTVNILKSRYICIYLENEEEGYLVAMGFDRIFPRCINTTEVAFFFKEVDENQTRIDVVSFNRELAQFVSRLLFEKLEKEAP